VSTETEALMSLPSSRAVTLLVNCATPPLMSCTSNGKRVPNAMPSNAGKVVKLSSLPDGDTSKLLAPIQALSGTTPPIVIVPEPVRRNPDALGSSSTSPPVLGANVMPLMRVRESARQVP
jgi:hypothetical protein